MPIASRHGLCKHSFPVMLVCRSCPIHEASWTTLRQIRQVFWLATQTRTPSREFNIQHLTFNIVKSLSGIVVRARYKGGLQLRDSRGLSPHSLLIVSFNNKRGEPLRLQNYIKILNYNSTCIFFATYNCDYRIMPRLRRQYLHFSSLKTASWMHKEIFSSKFVSFARAALCCLYTIS